MARRDTPEVNAGSMADIAFLLLIFFLVATTMEVDTVISRRLPQKTPPKQKDDEVKLKEKNVFEIMINRNDQMLVEKTEYMTLETLKPAVLEFLDNGGSVGKDGKKCDYCKGGPDGIVDEKSSDHPNKAVISLKTDRGTSYEMFIGVHDVLGQAYTELRNRESKRLYGVTYEELLAERDKDKDNSSIADKIDRVKKLFPEIISEVEPTSN